METLVKCPMCNSQKLIPFLSCKDNSVSHARMAEANQSGGHETFTIVECLSCGFVFTTPRPEEDKLGDYYKSENYISHSNTNKGFVNSVYQIVRKYTLFKKLQLI